MGGLAVLLICAIYLLLAASISLRALGTSVLAGVAAVAFFLALPVADAVAGRRWLREKCSTEGVIQVKERLPAVGGIAVEGGVFADSPSYYGYSWIETMPTAAGLVDRATAAPGGGGAIEKAVTPKAFVRLSEADHAESVYFRTRRISVWDTRGSWQEIARLDWIDFKGGLAERMLLAFSDAGPPSSVAACGSFDDKRRRIRSLLHASAQPE